MAFGVLDDLHLALPPGSSILSESDNVTTGSPDMVGLKKVGNIVLIPQPSDSPNDPLNWYVQPLTWATSDCFGSMSVMLTPAIPIISREFSVSVDTASTWTIGLLVFWTGFTASVTAAGSNVIGKRPFILGSILIMVITNIWGAFASSFTSLAALRTLQGIASAPYETMVTALISDIFFLHERGMWLALWSLVISAGILIGQVIAGLIIDSLSYSATFGFSALVFGILLILSYFLMFETTYSKPRPTVGHTPMPMDTEHVERPEPYARKLRIFRCRVSKANFFRDLISPFQLMAYPAVLYGATINGFCTALVIGTGLLSTVLLTQPPYNLTPTSLGIVNIAPFLVGLFAAPAAGWMADAVAKNLARRNGGVFEPEFRILLMVIGAPIFIASFIGFGESVARGHPLPIVLAWLGVQHAGFPFVIQAALSYVLDCHAHESNLAFVVIAFFKAIFSFIATSFLTGFMIKVGVRHFFFGVAGVTTAVLMLSLPVYVYGKRFRSFVSICSLTTNYAGLIFFVDGAECNW
ncbi:major facilitator superfamily domain-containing protein [Ilyonectria robusta]|uniref:major facilitator superfamily domain-containing protein n=1 Tax=Ilyonectria robusta TaxID=1079257 RepID=UPI001E8CF23D|nr:major facilitator superfamily domain-containing protein [Ilyonectria robusta]KAH8650779.1 major facilitator superfamily domain-containing protein [Ilyonectria robusta]